MSGVAENTRFIAGSTLLAAVLIGSILQWYRGEGFGPRAIISIAGAAVGAAIGVTWWQRRRVGRKGDE